MNSLDLMKQRAGYKGYNLHDNQLVKGKFNSFEAALTNSYQAEFITYNGKRCRCLINPEKLTENYDQKIISIGFDSKMKNGDTFYWNRTNTHWLVYLQDFSEEAYFRGRIRRCDYEIDVNGTPYWIYLRGPVETALVWRQKHKIEINDMNLSMLFYVTKNEETIDFFSRLQVVKIDGHNWRVSATDKYTQDGLIEVYVEEYYDNELEDDMIVPEIIKPDLTLPHIEGPQLVNPYDTNLSFSIVGASDGYFVVNNNKVKIVNADSNSCVVDILTGKSGQFILTYKTDSDDINLDVTIKSF